MTTPAAPRLGHRPALDGLRAVAVVAVLCNHAWAEQPPFAGGQIGVDVFFVLSGFLITALLVEERAGSGRVRLHAFYVRRALRILPVLVLVTAVAAGLALAIGTPASRAATLRAAPQALFFIQNWDLAGHQGALLGGYLGHTWSLSIEEQFYLLWPLLLAALMRRGGVRLALAISAGLAVAGQALSLVLAGRGDSYLVYFGTPTHGSLLLIGCALSLTWVRRQPCPSRVLVAAASAFLAVALGLAPPGPLPELGAALCAAVLILRALDPGSGSLLSNAVMRWVGRRSYGIYLWGLMLDAAVADLGLRPGLARLAVDIPLTFVVAHLSYVLLERPAMSLTKRQPAPAATPVPAMAEAAPAA